MNRVTPAKLAAPSLALIACASSLLACRPAPEAGNVELSQGDAIHTPDATPLSLTATSTITPEPTDQPALDPSLLWINAGPAAGQIVASASSDGSMTAVSLPLEGGQTAGSIAAAQDGSALAYIVWGPSGSQQGAAVWTLTEDTHRIVTQAEPGRRIIALTFSGGADALATVEVEDGQPLDSADWALNVTTLDGETFTAASRDDLGGSAMLPFAWPQGGPILLSPAAPGSTAGIVAVNPQTGGSKPLTPPEEPISGTPQLSPDGTRLAYVAVEAGEAQARVLDLRMGGTVTVQAPPDTTLLSLRWLPDGERLLLDLTAPSPADDGGLAHAWALVDVDEPEHWQMSAPRALDGLFDYAPLGETAGSGIAYTLTAGDAGCELAVLPHIDGRDAAPITLQSPAQPGCAPFMIRIP